jgi:hypothetical protein
MRAQVPLLAHCIVLLEALVIVQSPVCFAVALLETCSLRE